MKIFKYSVVFLIGVLLGSLGLFFVLKSKPSLLFPELDRVSKTVDKVEKLYGDLGDKKSQLHNQLNDIFDRDLFDSRDPFAEMRKMREQMAKRFKDFEDNNEELSNPFDTWYEKKFGGGSIDDIQMREDEKYIYYDVIIEDLQSTSVSAKVENEMIEITGKTEKNDSGSMFTSTFQRSFPVPQNVDPDNMEMLPGKGKIILKFKKVQI